MSQTLNWQRLEQVSPLLAVLPDAARRTARVIDVPQGGLVFNRGDRPKVMYFVISGAVHLVRRAISGNEIVLQRADHGVLAEASLDQTAYHCDAIAARPSSLLSLPRKAFSESLADERFRNRWIAHLARELRRIRAQSERLSLKTAHERIVHYIETEGEHGSITLTHSKKSWATELGLTHEALYRTLAHMKRAGLVSINGPRISFQRD